MKRNIFFVLFGFFALLLAPAAVSAEDIRSFDADYSIGSDGTLRVVERILYDFDTQSRHGIYRTLPETKQNEDGKKFVFGFSNITVSNDGGASYHFSRTSADETLSIKIGDADRTITGTHPYNIRYDVTGAFTYFSDHDELYWNVTGNDWEVPLQSVSATVTLPAEVAAGDVRLACYTGPTGSTQQFCSTKYDSGVVEVRTNGPLGIGEGLTIVVGFPKNIIAVVEPKPFVPFWETLGGKIFLTLIVIAGIFWYVVWPIWIPVAWWQVGRDPKPAVGVATAWFEAPKTQSGRLLTPGETGTVMDERADMADISGTIVDLARRGYLTIIEDEKNTFALHKLKKPDDDLQPFEKKLLTGIFQEAELVSLKGKDLSKTVSDTKDALYNSIVSEGFFAKNPQTIRTLYEVLAGIAFFTFNFQLAISAVIFGRNMPKKTMLGAQTAAIAKSLRNFIVSQDKQFAFQAKHKLQFEKMLPYAVVFGVEKIWAERFAGIAVPAPSWYVGYHGRTFNSVLFVNSLSSSMTSFRTAATPTRSSSGFSSGFSGGSSGGGGGGGGGGSW